MGEFNMTWLLHTPFTKTLPVGLGRCLCLAAARDRQRLHAGLLRLMIVPLLLAMQCAVATRPSASGARRQRREAMPERSQSAVADQARTLRQDVRRRHARARAARSRHRAGRDASCSSARPAAARPRPFASSPDSSSPDARRQACSSTATDVTRVPHREAPRRDGVPVLRAVSAHRRPGQHRLRPEGPRR